MSPRNSVHLAALLLAVAVLSRVAAAATPEGRRALSAGDVRKAEKVLSQLRLLHEAAEAEDDAAYRRLASKFYPDLFIKVAELPAGDLGTDLSTAVFLAERLGRAWPGAGVADCRAERPDIYGPLCLDLRGGDARQLLLAKSRLHARWAEASLKACKGERDAETARALKEVADARANDERLAASAVEALRRLESSANPSEDEYADSLREVSALLSWLPRSQTFYHLLNARDAYRDGLWWHDKARRAKSLVVSARGFAPDPLKDLRLDAEQVGATAQANLKSAAAHARLASLSLAQAPR